MEKHHTVAKFVQQKVRELGKSPQEIAEGTGRIQPERVLQIMEGKVDLHLDDVVGDLHEHLP